MNRNDLAEIQPMVKHIDWYRNTAAPNPEKPGTCMWGERPTKVLDLDQVIHRLGWISDMEAICQCGNWEMRGFSKKVVRSTFSNHQKAMKDSQSQRKAKFLQKAS